MQKKVKNNSSGFTLIEILAVVTIVSLIFILVIPKISTSIKNKKEDVDKTTTNLVISATKLYVSNHSTKFEKTDGNVSCLPLRELVKKGYLDGPIKNVTDDKDITNSKSVRITYDNGFKYELVDSSKCMIAYTPPCPADYCDDEGNEYTEVEYLESTGTQYIDTGVKVDNTIKVDTSIAIISKRSQQIFGVRESYLKNAFGFSKQYHDVDIEELIRFAYGNDQKFDYSDLEYSSFNNYIFDANDVYINGNKKNEFNKNNINEKLNLYIFTVNNNGTPHSQYASVRVKYFKIWKDNILLRDYIPVIDSNKNACLFDKINNKCYYDETNHGFLFYSEDEFDGYKDYNNRIYRRVNYLESNGTQYIDTGFKPNQDTRIETHIYRNKYDKSFQFPFGSRSSAGSNEFEIVFYQAGGGWRDDYGNTENRKFLGYTESTGEFYIDKNKNVTTINDISVTHNLVNFQSNYNLTIFGTNQNTGVQSVDSDLIKLYSFKLYDNGNIIRDYIPVIDEVYVACLFDKIEKKCYYNQGTGEFLYE